MRRRKTNVLDTLLCALFTVAMVYPFADPGGSLSLSLCCAGNFQSINFTQRSTQEKRLKKSFQLKLYINVKEKGHAVRCRKRSSPERQTREVGVQKGATFSLCARQGIVERLFNCLNPYQLSISGYEGQSTYLSLYILYILIYYISLS